MADDSYADLSWVDAETEKASTSKFEMGAQGEDLDSDLDFNDTDSEMDLIASMERVSLHQAGHSRQSEKKGRRKHVKRELEQELKLLLEDQQQWEQEAQHPHTPATPLPTYDLLFKKKGKNRNSANLTGNASSTKLTCADNCSDNASNISKSEQKGKETGADISVDIASHLNKSTIVRLKSRLSNLEGQIHQYVSILQCRGDANERKPLKHKQKKKLKEMRTEANELRKKLRQEERRESAEHKANKGKTGNVAVEAEDVEDNAWPELLRQKAALKVDLHKLLTEINSVKSDPTIKLKERKRQIKDLKERKSDIDFQFTQLKKLEKMMRKRIKEAQNQVCPVVRLVKLSKMISIWREAKHSELQEMQCSDFIWLFYDKERTNDSEISDAELSDCSPDHTEDVLQEESFHQNSYSEEDDEDDDFDVNHISSTFTDVCQDDPVTCVSQENECRPVGKIQGKSKRDKKWLVKKPKKPEDIEKNKPVVRQIDDIVKKTRYFQDVDDSCFLVKRLANMLLERRQQRNMHVAPDSVAGQLKERNMARNVAVDQLVTQMAATLKLTTPTV